MWKLNEYCDLFKDALNRNESVVLSCRCKINYSGRAESFLDMGDRIIIIKSDNTLLVHQPQGNNPINYMKPNTTHNLIQDDKKLFLKSNNLQLKESMQIEINKIYFFNTHKLEDGQSIIIAGTEADMSKMIYENPAIVEEGLRPVSQEEQTKYGFIDVFCTDKNGNLTIIECKRYNADLGAVTQLRRYVEKIRASKGLTNVRGIIAAPKISSNALAMLEDWGFKFVKIKPPKQYEKFDKKQKTLGNWENFSGNKDKFIND
ncbi:hypothetical protein COV11_04380 [Candidatus Woesearchaeota archaeon CG10_big_fil_rev_8_21_14_0_10_30_7]|nr:MAG: hypothetical protein COV11_04380 [Candidatus Woesearchaeota archaeon CG10_big_fil_rev_8_21_14_0_10_30_7]